MLKVIKHFCTCLVITVSASASEGSGSENVAAALECFHTGYGLSEVFVWKTSTWLKS